MKSPKNAHILAAEAGRRFVLSEYRFPCRERGNRGRYPRDGNVKTMNGPADERDAPPPGARQGRQRTHGARALFARSVCLLHPSEARRFALGYDPSCKNHLHMKGSRVAASIRPNPHGVGAIFPGGIRVGYLDCRRLVVFMCRDAEKYRSILDFAQVREIVPYKNFTVVLGGLIELGKRR